MVASRAALAGGAGLRFVFMSRAVFAIVGVEHTITIRPHVRTTAAVVALATSWIFGRLPRNRPRADARRAAAVFTISAPVTLIGHVFGEPVGGYSEATLGSRLIIPAILVFICLLMVIIRGAVVSRGLHPSAGGLPVGEGDQK
jgi:hypothetical protein